MARLSEDVALGHLTDQYEAALTEEEEARRLFDQAARRMERIRERRTRLEASLLLWCREVGLAEPPQFGDRLDFGWIRRRLPAPESRRI